MFSLKHPVLDFRYQLIYGPPKGFPKDPSGFMGKGGDDPPVAGAVNAMVNASHEGPVSPAMVQAIMSAVGVPNTQHVHANTGADITNEQAQANWIQQQQIPQQLAHANELQAETHRLLKDMSSKIPEPYQIGLPDEIHEYITDLKNDLMRAIEQRADIAEVDPFEVAEPVEESKVHEPVAEPTRLSKAQKAYAKSLKRRDHEDIPGTNSVPGRH